MPYDQKQLDDLYLRARKVLGSEATQTLTSSTQRRQAMLRATKAMGSPDKVTDEQILGALQIAHEVFPVKLEVMSKVYSQTTYRPLDEQDEWNERAQEEAEMEEFLARKAAHQKAKPSPKPPSSSTPPSDGSSKPTRPPRSPLRSGKE